MKNRDRKLLSDLVKLLKTFNLTVNLHWYGQYGKPVFYTSVYNREGFGIKGSLFLNNLKPLIEYITAKLNLLDRKNQMYWGQAKLEFKKQHINILYNYGRKYSYYSEKVKEISIVDKYMTNTSKSRADVCIEITKNVSDELTFDVKIYPNYKEDNELILTDNIKEYYKQLLLPFVQEDIQELKGNDNLYLNYISLKYTNGSNLLSIDKSLDIKEENCNVPMTFRFI